MIKIEPTIFVFHKLSPFLYLFLLLKLQACKVCDYAYQEVSSVRPLVSWFEVTKRNIKVTFFTEKNRGKHLRFYELKAIQLL